MNIFVCKSKTIVIEIAINLLHFDSLTILKTQIFKTQNEDL